MARSIRESDSNWPDTTWGTGMGIGAMSTSNLAGRGHILDARKRNAPPIGADVKPKKRNKRPKALSSVEPWSREEPW